MCPFPTAGVSSSSNPVLQMARLGNANIPYCRRMACNLPHELALDSCAYRLTHDDNNRILADSVFVTAYIVNISSSFLGRTRSRGTSIGIAAGYGLDGQGSITGRGKGLFSPLQSPHLLCGPTEPLIRWVPRAISPELKRPRREADHSPPFNTQVKKVGAIRPLPHTSTWRAA
jgi:hypothetical protein